MLHVDIHVQWQYFLRVPFYNAVAVYKTYLLVLLFVSHVVRHFPKIREFYAMVNIYLVSFTYSKTVENDASYCKSVLTRV